MKILREPLIFFLVIGAAIYLLYGIAAEPIGEDTSYTIAISAGDIESLAAAWLNLWNRLPTAQELDGLIQERIRETVLYRQALAMGLDKNDTVIRRRLAQKLKFLANDLILMPEPSDEELQLWFTEHGDSYQEPVLYTFAQVFIDPDKRDDATLDDAEKIKSALVALGDGFEYAGSFGDDFMLQNYYPERSRAEIQKLFGTGFAESLAGLPTGEWHGPVLSSYGVHLVYVSSRIEPPPPTLSAVRELVVEDWEVEKREVLNEQFYASLEDQFTIKIEEVPSIEGIQAAAGLNTLRAEIS